MAPHNQAVKYFSMLSCSFLTLTAQIIPVTQIASSRPAIIPVTLIPSSSSSITPATLISSSPSPITSDTLVASSISLIAQGTLVSSTPSPVSTLFTLGARPLLTFILVTSSNTTLSTPSIPSDINISSNTTEPSSPSSHISTFTLNIITSTSHTFQSAPTSTSRPIPTPSPSEHHVNTTHLVLIIVFSVLGIALLLVLLLTLQKKHHRAHLGPEPSPKDPRLSTEDSTASNQPLRWVRRSMGGYGKRSRARIQGTGYGIEEREKEETMQKERREKRNTLEAWKRGVVPDVEAGAGAGAGNQAEKAEQEEGAIGRAM